eukprot:366534-Chlamydomonas_euryale.AAC.6
MRADMHAWHRVLTRGSQLQQPAASQPDSDHGPHLIAKFNAAAASRFGSGWAWLGVRPDKSLGICSTLNQDNPLMAMAEDKMIPILGLDVWEVRACTRDYARCMLVCA